jgi:DNA polymerase-1
MLAMAYNAAVDERTKSLNMQNFPKRGEADAKEPRGIFKAPDGYWLVAIDQGQIEARCVAIVSCDEAFCEKIRHDYDIHQFWTNRCAELNPQSAGFKTYQDFLDAGKPAFKKFRTSMKNDFVFPVIYKAGINLIKHTLNLPDHIAKQLFDEFWEMHPAIREWQNDVINFAHTHGYVENLLGRRRHMPMSVNDIVNMPVQSLAFDLLAYSMRELSKRAYRGNKSHLQPLLQIHDELLFYLLEANI